MITSLNEFHFSRHYLYDSDNRFTLRIKHAKIVNRLTKPELAQERFKRAMYYLALEKLDKLSFKEKTVGVVFGNIYFRSEKRLVPAEVQIDNNRVGNVYVVIVKDDEVVTIKLLPLKVTNQEIFDNITRDGANINTLIGIKNATVLDLNGSKRDAIVVDLDVTDAEFNKEYPIPVLKTNKTSGLSADDLALLDRGNKEREEERSKVFSASYIPSEIMTQVGDLIKETVIAEGDTIFVPYPDGPKQKTIRKIHTVQKKGKRAFELEFNNTLTRLPLDPGVQYISTPKTKNEKYYRLLDLFKLDDDANINFQGKIVSVTYYSPEKAGRNGKMGLGVLIDPRSYF
jgi:hypothetical protein